MKKKIVVFGIGDNFRAYENRLNNEFEIIAYIDNNYEKVIGNHKVQPVEVLNVINNYDYVLIMADCYKEMYLQLIDTGIKVEKIRIWKKDFFHSKKVFNYRYYGQNGEDLIIAAIFAKIGIDKPTYIDLGANSPYEISNTAILYENGCRGINIEANPILIDDFRRCRPEDINLNIGIAEQDGKMQFYKFSDESGLNTFSAAEVKRRGGNINEIIELPVTTLENVVKVYCNGKYPDLLDCDIEGLDYDVLKTCGFDEDNGPQIIMVEVLKKDEIKFNELLLKKGYIKFCRISSNNIYIKEKFKHRLGL